MKWFKYFISILILSYASVWGPYYVSLFGKLTVLGTLDKHSRKCNASPLGGSECKVEYVIPRNTLQEFSEYSSLGLGVIIHAVEVGCSENGDFISKVKLGDPKNAGKTIDSLKIYLTVPFEELKCSGDVLVRVWSPKEYRRFGVIDGMLVVGDPLYVTRVKEFTEMFRDNFLISVAILFGLIFVFNSLLAQFSFGNSGTSVEKYQWAWTGYMIIFSGIFNTLIPLVGFSFEITRASNFFSIIARLGPSFERLRGHTNKLHSKLGHVFVGKSLFLKFTILSILIVALQISPYFAKALGPVFLVSSCFFLIFAIRGRDPFLFFWSLCGLIDGAKIMMVPYLPTGYTMMCMALFVVVDSFLQRVRSATRILASLAWSRGWVKEANKSFDLSSCIKEFSDRFGIKQATLILPNTDGSCEIQIERKLNGNWTSEKIIRNGIPEIFSHVLTTREPLWNIEQGSVYAENMRKGEPSKHQYEGKHFTVLPLVHNSVPVAALAFTNFSDSLVSDTTYQIEINSVTELLVPVWSKHVSTDRVMERSEWANRCAKAVQAIQEIQQIQHYTDNEFFEKLSEVVAANLDCGTFLGYLDPGTRKLLLKGFSRIHPEVERLYRGSDFYAVAQNEQGPVPLSVNRGKPAIVNDISWVKHVLHPNTVRVFEMSGIQSCASVPIFSREENHETQIWGVLWLESPSVAQFTQVNERGLTEICTAISSAIENREAKNSQKRTQDALSGFVPPSILAKLVKGESVRVAEDGYLLMADLRDSTKLSRTIGADAWVSFVSGILPEAEQIAKDFNFEIQAAIWDAIYFTRKSSHPLSEEDFADFCQKLSNLFEIKMCRYFRQEVSPIPYASKARFCLVYGDISRDVRHSVTSNWTIVGSSMAAISKMEQACKAFTGWIFVGESVKFLDANPGNWESLSASAKGTGEGIFRYKELFTFSGEKLNTLIQEEEVDDSKLAS